MFPHKRVAPSVALVCVVALGVASALLLTQRVHALQSQSDVAATLSLPMSPGALARLVELEPSAETDARLIEGLRSARSDVRAAAARVGFLRFRRTVVPMAATTLATETEPDALFEESRLVAYLGGPEYDPTILSAWKHRRVRQVLIALAGARREGIFSLLPEVRESNVSDELLADMLGAAAGGEEAGINGVVASALRTQDQTLFKGALSAARANRVTLTPAVVQSALASTSPELRGLTLWHLLREWRKDGPAMAAETQAALSAFLDQPATTGDSSSTLAYELVARAIGRPARSDEAWAQWLRSPHAELRQYADVSGLSGLLSANEQKTLAKALDVNPEVLEKRGSLARVPSSPADGAAVTTTSDYPAGLMSSVLSLAGCDIGKVSSKSLAGAAEVVLRGDGRLAQLGWIESNIPKECSQPIRNLFLLYTAPVDRVVRANERRLLMLPLSPDFVACQDSIEQYREDSVPMISASRITPPRKTRDVKPIYPKALSEQAVQGTVIIDSEIAAAGCVRTARVIRSVHPGLDWAAIRAVVDWKFNPAQRNDERISVQMSVTVNFTLN